MRCSATTGRTKTIKKKPRECLREASVGLANESRQLPVGIPVVGRNTVVQPLDFN